MDMIDENNIKIAILINRKNTHIALLQGEKNTIVDVSGGYGKAYLPSLVHLNYSSDEFLFGEGAIFNDIYEDTYVFESILSILYADSDTLEIENNKILIVDILKMFFDEILTYISNVNPNYVIENISICYEKIQNENKDYLFLDVFEKLDIKNEKINFIERYDAIYNESINLNENDDKINILFIDNNQTSIIELEKESENNFSQKETIIENFSLSLIENQIYQMFLAIYKEKVEGKIDDNIVWKIRQLVYQNTDLLINKYHTKKVAKIYFNFCYPPFEAVITQEMLNKYLFDIINDANKKLHKNLKINDGQLIIYSENENTDFLNELIPKDINFSVKKMIFGVLKSSSNYHKNIEIVKNEKVKHDIGLFIYKNGEKVFLPIIKKDDQFNTNYDTIYLYHLPKHGMEIEVVAKVEDDFILINNLNQNNCLEIDEDLVLLSLKFMYSEQKKLSFTITNEGSTLDSKKNVQAIFNIDGV